ncbi:hypothetical protein TVAG_104680 [Trichomonas vaginalis G3]|uniref:Uncharacterized protein n=1 Tax=Trichomonas vaginalis (strain ATCC PRA-98 / G3) TaxID=412133 RepID=A2FNU2_TRIV3|nr:hypothetical protein TVAGG3_0655540 [Trichomonas vaginalis G3]EAX93423.1 hypothetical protein TVAG_104680 [Trichomonas vaginalis G3]KAI5506155.1 hypothetical protein TVAGG3_0655540 [Trichomonas vaginalis G3]|eukprot:XP_001306353.1 hypothetical protein [Trichomonas vaginalis G3]
MFLSLVSFSLSQAIIAGRGTIDVRGMDSIGLTFTPPESDKQNYFVVLNSNEFERLQTINIVYDSLTIKKGTSSVDKLYYFYATFKKTYEIPEFIIGYYPAPLLPIKGPLTELYSYIVVLLPTIDDMIYHFDNSNQPNIKYVTSDDLSTPKTLDDKFPLEIAANKYAIITVKGINEPLDMMTLYLMQIKDGKGLTERVFQCGGFNVLDAVTGARFYKETVNGYAIPNGPAFPSELKWGVNDLTFKDGSGQDGVYTYKFELPANSVLVLAKTQGMKDIMGSYAYNDDLSSGNGYFDDNTLAVVANSKTKVTISSIIYPTLRVILFNTTHLEYINNMTIVLDTKKYETPSNFEDKYHAVFFANPSSVDFDIKNVDYEIKVRDPSGVDLNKKNGPFFVHIKDIGKKGTKKVTVEFQPELKSYALKESIGSADTNKFLLKSGSYTKEDPDKGLSGGIIALIIIIVIVVIVVVAVLIWCCCCKKESDHSGSGENV